MPEGESAVAFVVREAALGSRAAPLRRGLLVVALVVPELSCDIVCVGME